MTDQHTPGPWRFEESTKTVRTVLQNYWLVRLDSWDAGEVNHEANARLIAAAPDLLEALELALVATDGVWEDKARAAIAKARGQEA